MHRPADADHRLGISLDGGILLALQAVHEDLRVVDAPDLDIQAVGAREEDVAIGERQIAGKEVDALFGQRGIRAVAWDDPGSVEDAALGEEGISAHQKDNREQDGNEGIPGLVHLSSSIRPFFSSINEEPWICVLFIKNFWIPKEAEAQDGQAWEPTNKNRKLGHQAGRPLGRKEGRKALRETRCPTNAIIWSPVYLTLERRGGNVKRFFGPRPILFFLCGFVGGGVE
jgi:hypothetical protein